MKLSQQRAGSQQAQWIMGWRWIAHVEKGAPQHSKLSQFALEHGKRKKKVSLSTSSGRLNYLPPAQKNLQEY